jgi:hypothetical protein
MMIKPSDFSLHWRNKLRRGLRNNLLLYFIINRETKQNWLKAPVAMCSTMTTNYFYVRIFIPLRGRTL